MSSTQQLLLGEGAGGGPANYIEDVFSTYLWTGNGTSQTITNSIDLSTKGGLVWIKNRTTGATNNLLATTAGGTSNYLRSNSTSDYETSVTTRITSFNVDGFSLGSASDVNNSGNTFVGWTFRKQPKFFDVVTWTGDGTSNRVISHNLQSVPGAVIVKTATGLAGNWNVAMPTLGDANALFLNTTGSLAGGRISTLTSTTFQCDFTTYNESGDSYIAYLFAHDAGGFGLAGTDNVISCGTFTTDGSGNATVSLGYEPQWILVKQTDGADSWRLLDNMRGMPTSGQDGKQLFPNTSAAEQTVSPTWGAPTATGFNFAYAGSSTYIYVAIRRGPMAVPTSGTSVYQANTYTGNATQNTTVAGNFGFPVDLMLLFNRSANAQDWSLYAQYVFDKLRGVNQSLATSRTASESSGWQSYHSFSVENSIGWGLYGSSSNSNYLNNSGGTWVANGFSRAPSFFDEVCSVGTAASNEARTHNLGAIPELIIVKDRSSGAANWTVYVSSLGQNAYLNLNGTVSTQSSSGVWGTTTNTATTFYCNDTGNWCATAGNNGVFYLFATCAGVSKVGSYTGNAGNTVVVLGVFGVGFRFVLIKRTDSTGGWYVWDSARGIIAGNDPYLLLNSTAAEVTGTDYIDTYSAGFEVTSTAPAGINANGGTYIFLAIA